MTNKAQLINQDSGNAEWYTPVAILDPVRFMLGKIDLDPASCHKANKRVRAKEIFTIVDDGLHRPWFGRVWMNPPFGDNERWMPKLISEYKAGRVSEALCICFANTETGWYQPLIDFPQCYLAGRTKYDSGTGAKDKNGPTKGSAVTYFGPNVDRFANVFSKLGKITISYPLSGTKCVVCGRGFTQKRSDALYCRVACKQKAKRLRCEKYTERD